MLNNEGANEEDINKAISDLTEAEANFELSKVPNKDELNSEIERAYDVLEKLKGFDHLEGIKIKLEDAILEAERVKNDENSLKVRDFKATNISKKNVTVQWSAPENSFGLEGYVLYKDGKKVAELGKDETTYKFKGLNRHTIYNFKIASSNFIFIPSR